MKKGSLEVGLNRHNEIVINHPDLEADENGVGHIVFSIQQALDLARVLCRQAHLALTLEKRKRRSTMKSGSRTNQCEECHWLYPFTYLAPLTTSKGTTGDVCGICALALSNKSLGIERTEFTGRMAEHLRLMALNWRRRHPDLKPKEATHAEPVPKPEA